MPLVGVLEPRSSIGPRNCFAAFQQGLRNLGYRSTEGPSASYEALGVVFLPSLLLLADEVIK
jgi:hypothetical protein